MSSVNKVILIGNLGKDPESRNLPSGEAVCTFSVATTETWKDKAGSKQERTDWHRVEFIGRIADVAQQYLKKGSKCYIEGRVQYDKWTDKDGLEKTMTKIRADKLTLLDSKGSGSGAASGEGSSTNPERRGNAAPAVKKAKLDDFDDDIPF